MIPQFAIRLAFGLALMWCLLPRKLVTSGFFRIQMLLTLGLCVLACLTANQLPHNPAEFGGITGLRLLLGMAAAGAFVGSVFWTLERRMAGTRCAICLLIVLATGLWATFPRSGHRPQFLLFSEELASGWLLGAAVGAMLLGHWYLTAPMMSLEPLSRANRLFLLAILVRTAFALVDFTSTLPRHEQAIWLTLRWLAGLIGPLILCILVTRILRYRNTQSATGVLFAAVILIFIGECAGTVMNAVG